jgi:Domain of unknown function (DUF4136)
MKAIALFAVFAAACYPVRSSGPEVQTVVSPSAPFAEYHTFSFGFTENPPTSYQASARSLEVERRVRKLMGAALREKGYVEDDTKPNFVVRFGAGTQQKETGGYVEDSTGSPDTVSFGKIKVDIFDASTKTEVWRGSAVSQIDLTKDIDNRLLERTVQGVLASFPTRSATSIAGPSDL